MMCNVSLGNKESDDFEFWMWCNVVKRIENITIVGNWPIHGPVMRSLIWLVMGLVQGLIIFSYLPHLNVFYSI